MKLYHAFTYDKMYYIKKHGIIASPLDGLVYCCDNEEDALEWIDRREQMRTGKYVRQLGLAVFETNEPPQESFDHTPAFTNGARAFVVKGDIHPKDLTIYKIDVGEDYFYHTLEPNTIPYEKPKRPLLFKIFKGSIQNAIKISTADGKIKVGFDRKLSETDYRELFDKMMKLNRNPLPSVK